MCRFPRAWLATVLVFVFSSPGVLTAEDRACVDAYGNTYFGDVSQRQVGMQPTTPCLPPGTWEAIRNGGQFSPGGLEMVDQAAYEAALKRHLEELRKGRR